MKPGEVWQCGLAGDPRPWYYLVLQTDSEGVDLVLLDSDGEPDCDPGDLVALSWHDVKLDDGVGGKLLWELVA